MPTITKLKAQTFNMDKETDNCYRLRASKGAQALFGSLYIEKAQWPDGATALKLIPEFVFDSELDKGAEV